ncbi:class I SAM-dependent methyltransferase [Nitrosopumilus sp.]|uniref:class I SAM-dependent methyltransferase n=1 Tax=Nitrosopumilus sp. TaxID=2024843 RepID=UPI003D0A2D71
MNITREIAFIEKKTDSHFSKIASTYRNLRTTDSEHIQYIKNNLEKKSKINIADVGCGDGRYSLELLRCLKDRCYICCIDANEDMLMHLKDYLTENNTTNFCIRPGNASKLPLENDTMDCIVTFNAIHHFEIQKFLAEVQECLKDDGRLFVYTRLRSQNHKSVWGKYFPIFADTEDRLYELNELEQQIQNAGMNLCSTKIFTHLRTSTLDRLIHQARNHHYSTFSLYDQETFDESLKIFQQNIKKNFKNLKKITWHDENILLEIKK